MERELTEIEQFAILILEELQKSTLSEKRTTSEMWDVIVASQDFIELCMKRGKGFKEVAGYVYLKSIMDKDSC